MGSQSGMQGKHAQDKGACPCCRMAPNFSERETVRFELERTPALIQPRSPCRRRSDWFYCARRPSGLAAVLQLPSTTRGPNGRAGKRIFEERLPTETPSQQPTYHQPEPAPSAAGFL